tara:strand:- start:12006 stop:14276 length:2271 start_codon:yes stop_codon:yes gene_type:complete
MKKVPLKWLTLPLLALATVITSLWLLLLSVDANNFKPQIESTIYDRFGIQLSIDGPLNWSINFNGLPTAALQLSNINAYLADKPLSQNEPLFAHISHLKLGIALKPLLNGTLAVDRLTVDGVDLNLQINRQGQKNWLAINARHHQPLSNERSLENASLGDPSNHTLIDFSLDTLHLSNVKLRYKDDQQQNFHQIHINDLKANTFNLNGQAFLTEAIISYQQNPQELSPIELKLRCDLSLMGLLQPSPDYPRTMTLRDLEMTLVASNNKARTIALQGDITYRLNDHAFVFDNFSLKTKHSMINLQVNGIPTLGHDQLTPTIDLTGKINVNSENVVAEATNIEHWMDQQSRFDVENEPPIALSLEAVVSGQLDALSQRLSLVNLKAYLDDTSIKGTISALIKPNQINTISSLLDIDRIDLSRYLKPSIIGKKTELTQQTVARNFISTALPLTVLDRANLLLTTHIDSLIYEGITVSKIRSGIEVNDGTIKIFQVTAEALQSTFDIDAKLLRHQSIKPQLTINASATGLDIAALLKTLDHSSKTPAAPLVSGRLNLTNNWEMTGSSVGDWQASLNGNSKASIQNGRLYADNIEHRICQAVAEIRQTKLSHAWPSFTALKASNLLIDWRRGHGKITDFTADLETLKIAGSGTIDLSTLQFLLDVNGQMIGTYHDSINDYLSDPACAVNAEYQTIQWPVSCQGQLNNAEAASCHINRQRLSDQLVQLAKKQAKTRVEDKLKEKLGDELKQLFNNRLEGLLR